jgi:hypothetical protein
VLRGIRNSVPSVHQRHTAAHTKCYMLFPHILKFIPVSTKLWRYLTVCHFLFTDTLYSRGHRMCLALHTQFPMWQRVSNIKHSAYCSLYTSLGSTLRQCIRHAIYGCLSCDSHSKRTETVSENTIKKCVLPMEKHRFSYFVMEFIRINLRLKTTKNIL